MTTPYKTLRQKMSKKARVTATAKTETMLNKIKETKDGESIKPKPSRTIKTRNSKNNS